MENQPMIDLKTAVNAAYEYTKSIQELMGNKLQDLRLEEVEMSEDKSFWFITLGYDTPVKTKSPLEELGMTIPTSQREYKLFKVNSTTGEVEAMKIRKV